MKTVIVKEITPKYGDAEIQTLYLKKLSGVLSFCWTNKIEDAITFNEIETDLVVPRLLSELFLTEGEKSDEFCLINLVAKPATYIISKANSTLFFKYDSNFSELNWTSVKANASVFTHANAVKVIEALLILADDGKIPYILECANLAGVT